MYKNSLLLVLILSGCAQSIQPNTPSKRPEVCIRASQEIVAAEIAGKALDRGYRITEQTTMMIVAEKDAEGMLELLYASQFNASPIVRATFNLVKTASCMRVVANLFVISNPNSGYQKIHPMNDAGNYSAAQAWLDDIKNALETKRKG